VILFNKIPPQREKREIRWEVFILEVQPIRDPKKILAIRKILRAGKYGSRDDALFMTGINSALRISDLLSLSVGDVLNEKGKVAEAVSLKEKKTGKLKEFPLNKAIREVLTTYLTNLTSPESAAQAPDPRAPLFPSRKSAAGKKPITRWRALQILKEAGEAVGLSNIGTHSLRKTFGYHVYQKSGGNLGLVQKLLNHSSSADTLRYIGIDREQMDNTYLELNLGV
jgi:integrase